MRETRCPGAERVRRALRAAGGFAVVAAVALAASGSGPQPGDGAFAGSAVTRDTTLLALRCALLVVALYAWCLVPDRSSQAWSRTTTFALGILAGGVLVDLLFMPTAGGMADAGSLPDRLLRLGISAAYGIPALTLLAAVHAARPPRREPGEPGALRWLEAHEARMFGVASLSLPPALIGAAVVDQALVWLLPVGAWATLGGCLAGALRARRHGDRLSASGWLLVFASMAGGMLVGGFAFGGPLPAPAFLADYHGLGRTLVRGAHVISVTLGIAVIAAGASRTFAVAAR